MLLCALPLAGEVECNLHRGGIATEETSARVRVNHTHIYTTGQKSKSATCVQQRLCLRCKAAAGFCIFLFVQATRNRSTRMCTTGHVFENISQCNLQCEGSASEETSATWTAGFFFGQVCVQLPLTRISTGISPGHLLLVKDKPLFGFPCYNTTGLETKESGQRTIKQTNTHTYTHSETHNERPKSA